MPPREQRALLNDIMLHGGQVRQLCEEAGLEGILSEPEQRLSLERLMQIVGEAFTQALKQDESFAWRVNDAPRIVAFRQLLTHHYHKTSPLLLWDIAITHIPLLVRQTSSVLEEQLPGEVSEFN